MPEAFFYSDVEQNSDLMEDNFKIMKDAFEKAGVSIATAEFSITAYSLNTDLSFKFSNIEELLFFLGISAPGDAGRIEKINAMLVDAGIDPNSFFFVNFYKPKVAEL